MFAHSYSPKSNVLTRELKQQIVFQEQFKNAAWKSTRAKLGNLGVRKAEVIVAEALPIRRDQLQVWLRTAAPSSPREIPKDSNNPQCMDCKL
jgi:hypothetical protein